MTELTLDTARMRLILEQPTAVLDRLNAMPPEDRAQVSPVWLAKALAATDADPWFHGFNMFDRTTGTHLGSCGFKGPPEEGVVELAYGIDPEQRGRGYATEAALALVAFAFERGAYIVRAHTLVDHTASIRVLTKAGFTYLGDVIDPEDGLVQRWERRAAA